MNEVLKDVNSLWSRLFDHKVFLSGEIQFSLREYEQKRDDIEVSYLFSLLEKVCDITSIQTIRIKESIDNIISSDNKDLQDVLNICNSIIELEGTYQKDSTLDLARHERKIEWGHFIDSINTECKEIDAAFEERERELQDLYEDLEKKISVTTPH